MKRFNVLIAILVLTTVGAFAEDLTIKGKLTTTNRRHPEITASGVTYLLLIPRVIVRELNDGEEVTIVGEKSAFIPGEGFFADTKDSANYIAVKKITAKGKTVDVEKEFEGMKIGQRDGKGMRGDRNNSRCGNGREGKRGQGRSGNGNDCRFDD